MNQQPSTLRTSMPAVLTFLALALGAIGGSSQTLADNGLSAPAGFLSLCSGLAAVITGYLNQKKAEIAPPAASTVAESTPAESIQKTLALAAQQAFLAGEMDLVKALADARTAKVEVKS